MSSEIKNVHYEHPDVVGSRNRLGLILILVADIAFALSILFVYFYLRQQNVNGMWLPIATEETPAVKPVNSIGAWQITVICLLGLIFNRFAESGAREKQSAKVNLGTAAALVAAVVGLVMQIMQMNSTGFTTRMGTYASCYYLIAILNAVHLSITTFVALGNWNRGRLGLYQTDFWHLSISRVWWIWMAVSSGLGAFALSFS